MIIVLKPQATEQDAKQLLAKIEQSGLTPSTCQAPNELFWEPSAMNGYWKNFIWTPTSVSTH
ncbi:hypothetical protein [Dongshaea marina]|uniref:hypothetical protein n=1 Tax=Dongshaea marina TaxID=2047966 RepID=UPI0038990A52